MVLEGILNTRIVSFLALFLCNAAITAEAGDFTLYIGVGGGVFSTEYSEQGSLGSLGLNKKTWGSFIKAGIDYQQYLGVEVRTGLSGSVATVFPAGTLGSSTPIDLNIQTTNFMSYFIKAQYPVIRQFNVYGLLGGTAGRFKINSSRGLRAASVTWKTSLSYGLGVEYKFRTKGSISAEWVQYWNRVPLQITSNATSKASMYGISIMINKFF